MNNIKNLRFINRKKLNRLIYLVILICTIMLCMIKVFADTNLFSRKVKYNGQELSCYTDAIKYHTHTNGYEVILKQELPNNFYIYREIGPGVIQLNISETYKTKGYGNYVFKEDTNLFTFVEWCHIINAGYTEACSYRTGATPDKEWNYQKLIGYKGQKMSKDAIDHMNYFWTNMSNLLGETFKEYQDSYYFEKYVLKGMNKTGMTVARIRSAQNAHENGDEDRAGIEYMTAITSYMFALTPQSPDNFTVGKGDVVPFIYYKRKTEETNPKELARYAYIPLIEGWCTSIVGTNLWLYEYEQLFGYYNPDELSEDLETLQAWYDEAYEKYKDDKGRKGNNLLGSDITTIIQSDYSVSAQLEATEVYLDNMFNELGLERSYKENIARNQMMAEYMMQDSGLDKTIEDYNVSIKFTIENLQRGTFEPKNSSTAVLSDYQFIKLNHTLDIDGHSDNDTISDLQELGNIKWMDITSFVEKTYNDMKNKGEPCKSSLIEQIEDIVNKQGGNYLERRWGHVKVEGTGDSMRVYYRTYDYTSNPVLDDTDFDGIRDEKDSMKLNSTFTGTSTDIGNVSYNNDFRWFFTKNTKYNDELAVMSLIASNLANGKTISTNQVSGNITQYLENLGFVDVRCISNNGSVYMGKKTITYYGVTKNIYAVILGGGETEANYKAILDYVNDDKQTIKTVYVNNTKRTMQDVATEIARNAYFSTMDNTFWVTGYGVAGSIASEVGAKLTDKGAEVFCYTFGATNTGVGTKGTYINIKNVINEDDYIPKVANPNVYQRPGQIYSSSIKEDLMYEYREIVGNTNYKGDYYLSNYIGKVYNESLTGMSYDRLNQLLNEWSRHLVYYQSISKDLQENVETSNVALAINAMKEANKDVHSIKSYYVLSKTLNGFDLTDGDGEKIERFSQIHYLNTSSDQNITDDDYDDWWVKGRKDANGRYVIDGYSGYMRIEPSSNEKDIKAYYLIDGASDFGIDLPSGWSANIYARSFNPLLFYILMPDCINITSLYTKVLYKNDILENGKNEYEIRLHYTGSSVPSTPIYLAMQQHRDVTEKETGFVYGHIWESDDDSIYPTNRETYYRDKWFIPRDTALIYYMSLSGSEDPRLQELVARFIQGSINIASYVVDLEGLAEDIVDYSVKGFAGIVSKYDPSTAGIIKGSWVVAKNGYDLYGIRIDPTSFVIGVLRDILNNLSDRIVNIINYKHDVGEAINVDSVIKEDGEKCIFNDYGLIDGTLINGYWKCESWGDQTYAYGEYGVKGDFRP